MPEQNGKPPKDWWDACMASVTGADKAAVCGHIFHDVLGGDRNSNVKPNVAFHYFCHLRYMIIYVFNRGTKKAEMIFFLQDHHRISP